MRNNSLAWSPTFPTSVLLASEDHNLYTFDIRSMETPTQIYKAHVAAVMSCDWSPTGQEFVSGGWDRTVRIWKEGHGSAPEVYHTKRMQRCVLLEKTVHLTADRLDAECCRRCSPQMRVSCCLVRTTATFGSGNPTRPRNSASSPRENARRSNIATLSKSDGRWTRRSEKCSGAFANRP